MTLINFINKVNNIINGDKVKLSIRKRIGMMLTALGVIGSVSVVQYMSQAGVVFGAH